MAELSFDETLEVDRGEAEPAFLVDVDGYEGPLDLLLELARRQKVDLAKISVLALAEQYLEFIETARQMRLELAADYLVMAAWLAYLKSRLLLPAAPEGEEPAAADLAAALAERLRLLEAIRAAADKLMNRPRVGREMFLRGQPEGISVVKNAQYNASLFELLNAYSQQRQTQALSRVVLKKRVIWTLTEAREALERLAGTALEWTVLDQYLLDYAISPQMRKTVRASGFVASLELVREGRITLRQDNAYAPIWVKANQPPDESNGTQSNMEQV